LVLNEFPRRNYTWGDSDSSWLCPLRSEGAIVLEAHSHISILEEMLHLAKFDISITENMEPVVWDKLIINAAINPLTALLRVKNGDLLSNPPARALMGSLPARLPKWQKRLKWHCHF